MRLNSEQIEDIANRIVRGLVKREYFDVEDADETELLVRQVIADELRVEDRLNDEVRELIDAEFGRFYGMSRDPDLNQVKIRFRVRQIETEALERRQMRVQHAVLVLLADDVEIESLRVVTNRADGTGEVGAEVVITKVDDIRRVEGEDLTLWRQVTRRSSDGGKTWTGPE